MDYSKGSEKKTVFIFFVFYFIINMFFLDSFPFVHADEAWLASLSRAMMKEKSIDAVEDFFILTERHPHALKTVFHLIQIPFIKISFSIVSVRIISLLFAVISLCFFYKMLKDNISDKKLIYSFLFLFAADIQFVYISRFARQEIIILTALIFNLYLLYNTMSYRNIIYSAIITGVCIGIHPNSFFIFTAVIFMIIGNIIINRKNILLYLKYTCIFILITAFFAAFFITLSLFLDSGFFKNYYQFGARHGVSDLYIIKILKLKRFYFKMFHRISGTYFLPDIKFQLIMFASGIVSAILLSFFSKEIFKKSFPLIMFSAGINTAFVIIGKYSPPSVSFIFPAGWFLLSILLNSIKADMRIKYLTASILIIFVSFNTILEASKWTGHSFNKYSNEISSAVDDDKKVFGCINTAFSLKYNQLASYNDIEQFEKSGISFKDYIYKNNIGYIIYTEELDIIYRERPLWNDLYGNIYPYYKEINNFLESNAVLIKDFKDPVYPVRITDYMKRKDFSVRIYRTSELK